MSSKPESPPELRLPLRKPLASAEGPIDTLVIREPTIGQVDQVRALETTESGLELLFLTTGVLKSTLAELGALDFNAARKFLLAASAEQPTPHPLPETLTVPVRGALAERHGIFTIELREPLARELKATDGKSGSDATLSLIAQLTGHDRDLLSQLPMSSFTAADAYLAGFL